MTTTLSREAETPTTEGVGTQGTNLGTVGVPADRYRQVLEVDAAPQGVAFYCDSDDRYGILVDPQSADTLFGAIFLRERARIKAGKTVPVVHKFANVFSVEAHFPGKEEVAGYGASLLLGNLMEHALLDYERSIAKEKGPRWDGVRDDIAELREGFVATAVELISEVPEGVLKHSKGYIPGAPMSLWRCEHADGVPNALEYLEAPKTLEKTQKSI